MVFDILAFGEFTADRVRATHCDTPRPSSPLLDQLIASEWERQVAEAKRHDRVLFNGELLRYVRHHVSVTGDGAVLELAVGPTCYRDFVGTNLFNHDRLAEFGWEQFANPIGTTATLTTCDGRIVYGRRSERVAYHAGFVHTFGGALEAADRAADGRIDPFGSVLRELEEEAGIVPADLDEIVCVGLARDREIVQPELLFEMSTRLTFDQLCGRWQHATSRDEHCELVWLADAPEAIEPFIARCGKIAPVAVAALWMHGRRRWGDE